MSDTAITRPFAGSIRTFDLTYPLALDFEREQRKSLYATFRAAMTNDWRIRDMREVIRLALIGGGANATDAEQMVEDHVKAAPIATHARLAIDILEAAFLGVTDPVKEEADRVFGGDEQ